MDENNPILKFQKEKGGTTAPVANSSSSNPILQFAGKVPKIDMGTTSSSMQNVLGGDSAYVPKNVDDARKLQKENPTVWKRISTNLLKPIGTLATIAEETGKAIGGDDQAIKSIPKKLGGIWSGTQTRTFTDVFKENWEGAGLKIDDDGGKNVTANFINELLPSLFGLVTDVAADPLNYIGGGLTAKGKLIEKVGSLKQAGEVIAKDSKIAAQLKAFGLTDDMLTLAPTKAEQVQKGQRALLTLFANTRWEKSLVGGASIYQKTAALKKGFTQTRVAQNINKVFNTKTSNEAFNATKEHFTNLLDYRKGEVMDEAIRIQNSIGTLAKDDAAKVVDLIETAGGKPVSVVDDASKLAKEIQDNLAAINEAEKKAGLRLTEIQDYFPHILRKGKDTRTGWQKFKDLFNNSNDVPIQETNQFAESKKFSTNLDAALERKYQGTVSDIRKNFGIDFEDNAAIAYAKRALGSAKAVTSKEFFDSVKQFGVASDNTAALVGKEMWTDVPVKSLKGLKFAPDVAEQINQYYTKVKPEELNKALRAFDSVQNWWKAQALTAPSYHIRNFVGNMWNNFLAGVVDPQTYYQAGALQYGKPVTFTDDAGRVWNNQTLLKAAKQGGVINEGWYAKDIETALSSEIGGISWNPLKQNFALFRANRTAGSVLENNARIAHFIDQIKKGRSIDDAAMSVKKYLFDYGDLTAIEKTVFKRAVPFYTWTRKNIPLQLQSMIKQPAKFSAISKVTNAIEANVEKPNEKYLGDYIKDNVGIRVGTDKKGNTMYFLLGNWLPASQAIDFLSQPTENFIQSISPFVKTPIELWANQSTFFEDSFGQPSKIERYPEENQSWLGFTMRKKTAYVLKNIRLLNELDKLNPGAIFGDDDSPSLANRIAPEAGFRLPGGIGTVTTSEKRTGRFTPESTQGDRILQSMFGKTTIYNPNFAKKFYLWDTETKVEQLTRAIRNAQSEGQKEYAKRLRQELQKIKKERN